MPNLYDLAYYTGLGIAAPFWLLKSSARNKVMTALRQRNGKSLPAAANRKCILIHAVSVGEINAVPALLAELRKLRPDLAYVVSVTTQTGYERGAAIFKDSPDITLIRFPLDFTAAVVRVLETYQPIGVVLMELEVWPNFMRQCAKRKIPVLIAAGRITAPAMKRYKYVAPIARKMFARLSAVAAQDQLYADRFRELGVPADRISVLGTMKFDSATVADRIAGDSELARDMLLNEDEPLWVCGSTGPGEEQIVLDVYRQLLAQHPKLRLAIIPRHPPRFDDVAKLIESNNFTIIRRSASNLQPQTPNLKPTILLGDTMGELRKFYSLATVVFVGRSLVDLGPRQHGSDMIEPAALAKACIVGPFTGNFDMPVRLLRAADGIIEVNSAAELSAAVDRLLRDAAQRTAMAGRAQTTVKNARGSTAKHAALILEHVQKSGR